MDTSQWKTFLHRIHNLESICKLIFLDLFEYLWNQRQNPGKYIIYNILLKISLQIRGLRPGMLEIRMLSACIVNFAIGNPAKLNGNIWQLGYSWSRNRFYRKVMAYDFLRFKVTVALEISIVNAGPCYLFLMYLFLCIRKCVALRFQLFGRWFNGR